MNATLSCSCYINLTFNVCTALHATQRIVIFYAKYLDFIYYQYWHKPNTLKTYIPGCPLSAIPFFNTYSQLFASNIGGSGPCIAKPNYPIRYRIEVINARKCLASSLHGSWQLLCWIINKRRLALIIQSALTNYSTQTLFLSACYIFCYGKITGSYNV